MGPPSYMPSVDRNVVMRRMTVLLSMYISRYKSPGMWRRVVRRAVTDVSKASIAASFLTPDPEKRGINTILRNAGNYVFKDTASYPKRLESSVTPLDNLVSYLCLVRQQQLLRSVATRVFPTSRKLGVWHSRRCAVGISVCPTEVGRGSGDRSKLHEGHQLQSRTGIKPTLTRVL